MKALTNGMKAIKKNKIRISNKKNIKEKNISLTNLKKGNIIMKQENSFLLPFKSMLIIVLLLYINTHETANAQTSVWTNRYNGVISAYDVGNSVATDPAGNVYVTGTSDAGGTTHLDYCTIKYSPSGMPSPTWPDMGAGMGVRKFNGAVSGFDEAHNVCADISGNVYVTGYVTNGPATSIDYCTIKYSPSGFIMWTAMYDAGFGGSSNHDLPYAMTIDIAGNVYVTGESQGVGGFTDFATIKYGPSGIPLWISRYDGPGHKDDAGQSIKVDPAGNVYVTGYSDYGPVEAVNFLTIKYSPSGTILWVSAYNYDLINNNDYGYSLAVDAAGNVFVTGESYGGPGTGKDYATIKYTPAGIPEWVKRYNGLPGTLDDIPTSIGVDPAGNIYVTGKSAYGMGGYNYATIKYNTSGTQLWAATYAGPGGDDEPGAMVVDKSGNAYVTGKSLGPNHYDYATVKYDSSGNLKWTSPPRYNGLWTSANDQANAIALDSAEAVIVTGFSSNAPGGPIAYDIVTIKYISTVTTLTAVLAIEGLLNTSLASMTGSLNQKDTVRIYLRNTFAPFLNVDSAITVIDSASYSGAAAFKNVTSGIYYIEIKHRNGLQTWSKPGGEFITAGIPFSYDFTFDAYQAYGNNLTLKGSKFCIYSGDPNQDGFINLADIVAIFNDAGSFLTGYVASDLTGDNIVNLSDLIIAFNNSSNFVSIKRP